MFSQKLRIRVRAKDGWKDVYKNTAKNTKNCHFKDGDFVEHNGNINHNSLSKRGAE